MPLPKPKQLETRTEFMQKCMSNKNIQEDFDTNEQKVAVCESLFKHKKKKASYVINTADETYLYTITPEDQGRNPLDDDSDTPETPQKPPDKWPTEAPKALDDTPGLKPGLKASDFKKSDDYEKSDQSNPPASYPSLHSGGINPNPDNSKNFPIKQDGNWKMPKIDDMKWLLCNENGIPQNYTDPNPDINKLKEWYVGEISKMPEDVLKSDWPSTFKKIEKEFDRPNKIDTPEVKLKNKQSEENRDTNKIAEKDKPYVI